MKLSLLRLLVLAVFSIGLRVTAEATEPLTLSTEALVRARCDTSGRDVFTVWTGKVYAMIPNEKSLSLFGISGMNVARCFRNSKGEWLFVSRELNYYLDEKTGEPIHEWTNPWIKEVVPVVHVANNPVQINYGTMTFPAYVSDGTATFQLDIPLSYPNALALDSRFSDYSPEPIYQAVELFKLTSPLVSLQSDAGTSAPLLISWDRTGPWLPWMKMKGKAGYLVYSAMGRKLRGFDELPIFMQKDILNRLPLYRSAPSCWLNMRNETSWSYFAKVFDRYLERALFPLEAPVEEENCATTP